MPEEHSLYLHDRADFEDLLRIVADERKVLPELVEKDYWIARALHGLVGLGFHFEIKGGTSLSKGFGLIHRFSEDIDIKIDPRSTGVSFEVHTGVNQTKKDHHIQSRKDFYDWIAGVITIDGFDSAEREVAFDDEKFRSGGVTLKYTSLFEANPALKAGVLLELGFDDTEPAESKPITSWAGEKALQSDIEFSGSNPIEVMCYHPGYTLVEKLQAVSTKFRQWEAGKILPANFIRHYYDIYCLLGDEVVLDFIGTPIYEQRKEKRFREQDNKTIIENPAFLFEEKAVREAFEQEYINKADLYFEQQVPFSEILARISELAPKL